MKVAAEAAKTTTRNRHSADRGWQKPPRLPIDNVDFFASSLRTTQPWCRSTRWSNEKRNAGGRGSERRRDATCRLLRVSATLRSHELPFRLYSHGETGIADTRGESHGYWESQIACHTHTAETEVSESPSTVKFQKRVRWISKNVSKCFFISSDSCSDDDMIISITTAIEREKQEDFGYTPT